MWGPSTTNTKVSGSVRTRGRDSVRAGTAGGVVLLKTSLHRSRLASGAALGPYATIDANQATPGR